MISAERGNPTDLLDRYIPSPMFLELLPILLTATVWQASNIGRSSINIELGM